jgi:hypothetical protein
MIIQIAIWIVLGVIGGTILARKGYSPVLGVALGILCGPVGLIVAAVLPWTKEGDIQRELREETDAELLAASQTRPCPNCGRENSVATLICPRCDRRLLLSDRATN